MKKENLIGSLALVNPDLAQDPVGKQGQVGVISYVDNEAAKVYMAFPGKIEGLYNGKDVLRLQDKNKILETLVNKGDEMPLNDFKALYKISMLLERNTSTGVLSALDIARDNPNIRDITLEAVSAARKFQLEKVFSR